MRNKKCFCAVFANKHLSPLVLNCFNQILGEQLISWHFSLSIPRSSRPQVFLGKDVLEICSKFTEEQPCGSAISIKLL